MFRRPGGFHDADLNGRSSGAMSRVSWRVVPELDGVGGAMAAAEVRDEDYKENEPW